MLGRPSSSARDLCTNPVCVADSDQPDTAGCSVDHHGLAAVQCGVLKGNVSCGPGGWQRARLLGRQGDWLLGKERNRRESHGGKGRMSEAYHAIRNLQVGSCADERAGHVTAGDPRISGIFTEHIQHIAKVEADCLHPHQDFVVRWLGQATERLHKQVAHSTSREHV